ncbi:MAG: MFS transporter, partial [Pseudomonadota bacterium]
SPFVSAPAFGWLFYTLSFVSILTLLPPFLDPSIRAFVIGAMPLISIASSLLLGVWMLRRMTAVVVMQVGFVASAGFAVALAVMPGNPAVALALAAALGLVQGAGFAAVPQLNETTELRAQANGALAQAGNVGNTLGTPVLLVVIGMGGHTAFLLSVAAILVLGYFGQVWLARQRAA